MNKGVFTYLRSYSFDPEEIDRLIVSAYLLFNSLEVYNNNFVKSYIINIKNKEKYTSVIEFLLLIRSEKETFDFENLIELFEFVISPSDKIVNGAVYTPILIREYIVKESLNKISKAIPGIKVCDISCGCGGFLLTLTTEIKKKTNRTYFDIFKENIYGIDITEYSITRAKLLLSLYAIQNGEDCEFIFNLKVGNSLTFDWKQECDEIRDNSGFDIIAGNPPYVSSRNMDDVTLALMGRWKVTASGHPDLYIPFFQIGYENLNDCGILGLITVNTFTKSVNGRALRQYFSENNVNLTIINFGGEQLFKDRNTYTCICFLSKKRGAIEYIRVSSNELKTLNSKSFNQYEYESLNHIDGWNLVNSDSLNEYISVIESTGSAFKEKYITRNGIATLKNNVYKFKPFAVDNNYYYLKDGDNTFSIEKGVCRDIVNANKLKSEDDLIRIKEKIIFPYLQHLGETKIVEEQILRENFPGAYQYLLTKQELLAKRDKGTREYEAWYAYGRRQSMDICAFKLFFPHICEKPNFVISQEKDLLFYNGIAVISNDLEELILLKKLLESNVFYHYIKSTTKDYSSGYISMSKNYIKNFGIYNFSQDEGRDFLTCQDPELYIKNLYNVSELLELSGFQNKIESEQV